MAAPPAALNTSAPPAAMVTALMPPATIFTTMFVPAVGAVGRVMVTAPDVVSTGT